MSMAYWELRWIGTSGPIDADGKQPSKGQTGVQHEHRTRGRDLRTNRNHVQILPGSSDDARLINAPRIFCKLAAGEIQIRDASTDYERSVSRLLPMLRDARSSSDNGEAVTRA